MARGGRVIVADCLTSSPNRSSERRLLHGPEVDPVLGWVFVRHQAGQTTGNRGWSISAPAGSPASRSPKGGEVRQAREACLASADR